MTNLTYTKTRCGDYRVCFGEFVLTYIIKKAGIGWVFHIANTSIAKPTLKRAKREIENACQSILKEGFEP